MLNEKQYKIVTEDKENNILVLACAGAGKTLTIIHRIEFLLKSGIKHDEILVTTFTRHATLKMKNMINEILKTDKIKIATIDSTCNSFVTKKELLNSKDNTDNTDYENENYNLNYDKIMENKKKLREQSVVKNINNINSDKNFDQHLINKNNTNLSNINLSNINYDNINLSNINYGNTNLNNINHDNTIENIKNNMINNIKNNMINNTSIKNEKKVIVDIETDNKIRIHEDNMERREKKKMIQVDMIELCNIEELEKIMEKGEEKKEKNMEERKREKEEKIKRNIEKCCEELENNRTGILKNIRYVFIDEYQDINEIQNRFFNLLWKDGIKIMAVGDHLQSIYGFRSASNKYLDMFNEKFKPCKTHILNINYRSTSEIVLFANNIFPEVDNKMVANNKIQGYKPNIYLYSDIKTHNNHIISEIKKYTNNGSISYDDIAILCRNKKPLTDLQSWLYNAKIPYQLLSDDDNPQFQLQKNKLCLSTIHRSKGLEWKLVFIIFCHDKLFPSPKSFISDTLEEEKRLFYVASTRSLFYLNFTLIPIFNDSTISRFISSIPSSLYSITKHNKTPSRSPFSSSFSNFSSCYSNFQ